MLEIKKSKERKKSPVVEKLKDNISRIAIGEFDKHMNIADQKLKSEDYKGALEDYSNALKNNRANNYLLYYNTLLLLQCMYLLYNFKHTVEIDK